MKKNKIFLAFLALIVIVGLIYNYFSHSPTVVAESAPVRVRATVVSATHLPVEINALGVLTAQHTNISAEVPGHIKRILFHEGALVKKGEVLIQLEDDLYQVRASAFQAKYQYQISQFNRLKLLSQKGVISKQMIDQAEADLKESKSNADENQLMLKKMGLTAPFDGVMGKLNVALGDYVTVGQNMVSLTDAKHLRVEYHLPEKYFSFLKLDQAVELKASAYPREIFTGKVTYLSSTVTADTRSIFLYADIPNEARQLAPGMFVNVTHQLKNTEKVLMIPARSLMPSIEGEQVYRIMEGKAYLVSVLTGKRIRDLIEITKGLTAGDQVITDGQLKVKNGLPVLIQTS